MHLCNAVIDVFTVLETFHEVTCLATWCPSQVCRCFARICFLSHSFSQQWATAMQTVAWILLVSVFAFGILHHFERHDLHQQIVKLQQENDLLYEYVLPDVVPGNTTEQVHASVPNPSFTSTSYRGLQA